MTCCGNCYQAPRVFKINGKYYRERSEPRRKASKIQSVIFHKGTWAVTAAKTWLRQHGFKCNKMDETPAEYRFRQVDPKKFTYYRSIPIGTTIGIRAIVAR